ncbi:hypothetical protein RSAG8_01413, partial [Rhizoctonia solani AG-8 WAC10335]
MTSVQTSRSLALLRLQRLTLTLHFPYNLPCRFWQFRASKCGGHDARCDNHVVGCTEIFCDDPPVAS